MNRRIAPLSALLVACASPRASTPLPAVAAVAPVDGEAPGGPPPPSPPWRVVAHDVALVQRLGDVLFAITIDPAPVLLRVDDDGTTHAVASGLPEPGAVMSRGGHLVASPVPTAILGEPGGPIWVSIASYSVFGNATVYRAEGGVFAEREPTPWSAIVTTPLPDGDRTPSGDLLAERSRGHLFAITNRVSSDGDVWILPRGVRDPAATVRGARRSSLSNLEATELANGDIVQTDGRADGRSRADWYRIVDGVLEHVRGGRGEPAAQPIGAGFYDVLVATDGTPWITREGEVWSLGEPPWRCIPLARGAIVVHATARSLFVRVEGTLLRAAI